MIERGGPSQAIGEALRAQTRQMFSLVAPGPGRHADAGQRCQP
jgi:hypothetical protein